MKLLLFVLLALLDFNLNSATAQSVTSNTINIANQKFGVIRSGGYPTPYGDNIENHWEIRVREGFRIHLRFTTFDLEDSYEDEVGACAYDYVQVAGHRRLCGNPEMFPQDAPRRGEVFKSAGNLMRISFISDYSNEAPKPIGFEAHWVEEDVDECYELSNSVQSGVEDWDQILYCNHFCNNVPGSYYCTCRPGFTLYSNHHTCVANCETEVSSDTVEGFVASTDYPRPYGKLSDCTTTLQAGTGMRLDVRFDVEFGIERHFQEGCVYDWIELTDDDGVSRRYCGNVAPNNGSWIVLNTNLLNIHFVSDLVTEDSGYKIYYQKYRVRCSNVLQAPGNGSISIPEKEFLEYEDNITFACNRGFRMQGSPVSVCMVNGEWSTAIPTCNIKFCPRPVALLNVSRTNPPDFEEDERPYNSSLTIPCINRWYRLVSGASEWFCDDDETWHVRVNPVFPNTNNNFPECRPYCGIKNTRIASRDFFSQQIFGGREAIEGEWPWMAFIAIGLFRLDSSSFCGGSLVDERYVVTAAHCFSRVAPNDLRVYLGVTDRTNASNPHIQEFSVISVRAHSGFNDVRNMPNNLLDNDIAVLKLDRPAIIGRYVRPICIPRTPLETNLPETAPKKGVVAGWGLTELNRPSEILLFTGVPYVNLTACRRIYQEQSSSHRAYSLVRINDNQFCAGFVDRARDSCDGDSGGPLMWRNNRRWFLHGIVSFGTSLESCGFFVVGVYTRVANYLEFLDNEIILDP